LDDGGYVRPLRAREDAVRLEAAVYEKGVVRLGTLEDVDVVLHRTDFDLANDDVLALVVDV
jgi:hypothetical protein